MNTKTRPRESYHVGNLAPLLLAAARKTLEESGAAHLSLRAIAKEVGVSATASYHHFATRLDLLGHLAAQGFRELCSAMATVGADPKASLPLVERASLAYLNFASANPALYQLMFGAELAGEDVPAELHTSREAAFDELRRIITLVLGPQASAGDVQRAAVGTWSYTHGLASLWLNGVLQVRGEPSNERLVRRTLQGLAHAIAAAQQPGGD